MRANVRARVRDRWWTAELVAGPAQCEQGAHTEVHCIQFGFAAAQRLGLVQAAQRGSDGGCFFLGVLASGGSDSFAGSPECALDDRSLVGWMWVAAGNAHRSAPNSTRLQVPRKMTFFKRAANAKLTDDEERAKEARTGTL